MSGRLLIDILDERDRLRDDEEEYSDDDEQTRVQLQREYRPELDFIATTQKCVLCGLPYKPCVNFLNYYCRMHTGVLFRDDETWSCCGRAEYSSGCRPCMHVNAQEIADSMRANAALSVLEIDVELIDYDLIAYNPRMITNDKGGAPSLIYLEDDDDVNG